MTAPISNGPTTHGYTTMRDATAQQSSPGGIPRLPVREKTRPARPPSRISAKKLAQHRPSSGTSAKKLAQHARKRPFWAIFRAQGELFRAHAHIRPRRANFFVLTHTSGHAARTFSRTRRDNVATLKPTTPLLTPNKGALKPASPLHPKNAPKTPISHPQRRWRFQLRLDLRPQRRWRFQLRLDLRPQRRWRFQTARPPGRQGLAVAPAGCGVARPRHPRADDVTNVVKPEQCEAPSEACCYKRRQSAPKNHYFQRKIRRIDDVCNNGSENHTKNAPD